MSKLLLITVFCILSTCLIKAEVSLDDALDMHKRAAEECMTEVGAKPSDIDDLINEKPSSSMEAKCMRACLLKKFDVMDSYGKVNREVVLEHARMFTNDDEAKSKQVIEIVDACLSIDVSSNHCEAAEEYCHCYKKEANARGFRNLEL